MSLLLSFVLVEQIEFNQTFINSLNSLNAKNMYKNIVNKLTIFININLYKLNLETIEKFCYLNQFHHVVHSNI